MIFLCEGVTKRALLTLLVAVSFSTCVRAADLKDRIAAVPASSQRVRMAGSVRSQVARAQGVHAAPGERQLAMHLFFRRTAAQQADMDRLLADQQNPSSPLFRKWLTPAQYAQRFGMSAHDLDIAKAWLQAQGMRVTRTAAAGNYVSFAGSVAQAQSAFATEMQAMTVDGEEHIANATEIQLPAELVNVVQAVGGLDDFNPKPQAHPRVEFTDSGTSTHFIVPADLQTIYDAKGPIQSGTDGTGVTLVVVGQSTVDMTSVATFRSLSGLPAKIVAVFNPENATTSTSAAFLQESYLDLEYVGAMAPNASIVYSTSENVFTSAFNAIDENVGGVVSVSYTVCESETLSSADFFNAMAQEANSFGITVVAATGDSGASGCDIQGQAPGKATQAASANFPSTSPYVTAVGGTMFQESGGTYWGSTNATNGESAVSYIPEVAWNETSGGGLAASGGGASAVYPKPAWQAGLLGVPADGKRDTPDVALTAGQHDGYIACTPGFCANGFRSTGTPGSYLVFGGTSAPTPVFAGVVALLSQSKNARVGNINPNLYALFNSTFTSAVFNDITSGNNIVTCVGNSACPAGTSYGFTAVTGYDQVTGLGSVDVGGLLQHYGQGPVTGVAGATASTVTVQASSAGGAIGTAVNYVVTVASADPSVTTVPTGHVLFVLNGSTDDLGTLDGNGNFTFSENVGGSSSDHIWLTGANTIEVRYLGDAVYAPSTSSTVTTTEQGSPSFTLSPPTTTITLAAGATSAGTVFTVNSLNGYAGALILSVQTSANTLAICPMLSSSSGTIAANGTLTTTLTVQAASCATSAAVRDTPAVKTRMPWQMAGGGAALASVLLLVMPRRRRWGPLMAMLMMLAMAGLNGCGSGIPLKGSTGSTNPPVNTPAGSYNLMVFATGSANGSGQPPDISQGAAITVVVQ